jgi:UPF0755 protein
VTGFIRLSLAGIILAGVSIFLPGPFSDQKIVIVTRGTSTAAIASELSAQHAIYMAPLFHITAKLIGNGSLKAGEYALPPHASTLDIVRMMHEGHSVVRLFMAAEGLTSSDIVDLLNNDPVLTGTIVDVPEEGTLLPESYRYDYGDQRAAIVTRMKKAMQDKLAELWKGRESGLPLRTPEEAVVLASIVEKETGKAEERPRIAGVFYNRLHLNMRLQSDPTVIYAITKGKDTLDRPLTHDDLSVASPINTYANDGLPPQPICNPGIAALTAVLHPEHNDYLYFVADGTGGHAFAADLMTQNQNINHWHQVLEKTLPHK